MNRPKVSTFVLAYILLIAAGIFFCIAPSSTFDRLEVYRVFSLVWGMFYIVGGAVALFSIVASWFKTFRHRVLMLNFFEVGGLFLIITSNVIYALTLLMSGIDQNEQNIIAASLVILGSTAIFPFRISKMWGHIRMLSNYNGYGAGGERHE